MGALTPGRPASRHSRADTPAPVTDRSPRFTHLIFRSLCLQPPVSPPTSLSHATPQPVESPAFAGLGFAFHSQARRHRPAESSLLPYGWIVHLLLLPTPPHGGAVAFGYRPESVYLERTFTSLIMCAFKRTSAQACLACLRHVLRTLPPRPRSEQIPIGRRRLGRENLIEL
jgi:hypothetical protein